VSESSSVASGWGSIAAVAGGTAVAVIALLVGTGQPVGIAVVTGLVAMVGAGWSARSARGGGPPPKADDARWTALLADGPAEARETLAAVEQLTDPLAIERRVTRAMRDLAPGAELELLRATQAPRGIMVGAREADGVQLVAAVQAKVLRTDTGVLLPVRYGAQVFGGLRVTGKVPGPAVLQLRRFADLLGFRLELHRLYAELAHRERLAALGTFASALSHDLRSPLSSVSLALQGLAVHRDALGADMEFIDIAQQETARMLALIAEILDFARPIDLDASALDCTRLAETVARTHEAAAAAAQVRLRVDVEDPLPPVAGDPVRMQRVLDNLVGNAIAFSPRGADAVVRVHADGDAVVFEVRDRGPGISAEDQARMFEPFFSRREGGTGLGLAIVDRIVDAHGGRMTVDSAPGRGTRIGVRLPARADGGAPRVG
jgi:signal transduction histidine kinase